MQHDVTHTHTCPLTKVSSAELNAVDYINTKQLGLGQYTEGFCSVRLATGCIN